MSEKIFFVFRNKVQEHFYNFEIMYGHRNAESTNVEGYGLVDTKTEKVIIRLRDFYKFVPIEVTESYLKEKLLEEAKEIEKFMND